MPARNQIKIKTNASCLISEGGNLTSKFELLKRAASRWPLARKALIKSNG